MLVTRISVFGERKTVLHANRYLADPFFCAPGLQQHVGKMLRELKRIYRALNNHQSTHIHWEYEKDEIFFPLDAMEFALIWHALKYWWQKVTGVLTTAGSSPFPRRPPEDVEEGGKRAVRAIRCRGRSPRHDICTTGSRRGWARWRRWTRQPRSLWSPVRLRTACQRRGREPFTRAGRTRASAAAAAEPLGANPRRPHGRAPIRVGICSCCRGIDNARASGKKKKGGEIVRALAHPVLTASSGVEATYRLVKLYPVNNSKTKHVRFCFEEIKLSK